MIVLDASVVLALLTGHTSVQTISALLHEDSDAVAPAHLDVEVMSALRGRMLGRHLTAADVCTAAARLGAMPVRRIPFADPKLLLETVRWFDNLTAYDACYAALALEFGATLLTGDKGLADTAARAKIACRHIDCSA
ncbi:type II toxin-antitoxin system VapC family toxin [Glycomyces terrestris]|uniref:PIN domain-containing protein n=1 Tax=Glycomyces terrestris TaxID=2493553 RepID=A0A426V1F9_9ACTN|nr:type II toxin-antitoxin system VapC family toxin [Glycomyces terrestris]RRS00702.1 PIN domain-containing protein [Glycomyces terrestris]